MRQLKFVALSFQNLPDQVVSEYRSLWEGHHLNDALLAVGGR
jgi:hypothetical protein